MAWQEPLRKSWRYGWMLLVALLVLVLSPLTSMLILGETPLECLLGAELRILFCSLLIVPVLTVLTVRKLCQVYQARKKLAAGVRHTTGENWRRSRSRWRVIVIMILVFWFGVWTAEFLWIGQEADTTGLPYVFKTVLLEGTEAEDWEVDLHTYRRQNTPLRPVWSVERFWYQEEYGVMNARSCLRFELLAKALYQESRQNFLKENPEAKAQAVERAAFDEAVLMQGEKEQMLLVRSGKTVYSLWVNFPADLQAQVDGVAARLA